MKINSISSIGINIRIGLAVALIFFFNLQSRSQTVESNQLKGEKQIVLFDGKSTDAWKDIESDNFPEHGWVVKDGI